MPDLSLLPFILMTALIASASPGPATLTIIGTSAERGRAAGLALAAGVLVGSLTWSVAAALGLSAVMLAHGWTLTVVRYAGAAYLLYLAIKSARVALRSAPQVATRVAQGDLRRAFAKGLLLHLTNPKAILFFGALYAVILSPGTEPATLAVVVLAVGLQSAIVFLGYAILFSRPAVMAAYGRAARGIHAVTAVAFGAFAYRLVAARMPS